MADTALSALTATTTLASGDLMYVVDGGNSRKIDWDNVVAQLSAATKTLTNTTIDANGTGNSISNIETADIAAAAKTGADTVLVTGTAGTSGNLASWNADGDLVDAGSATSAFATAAQGDLADTAVQPGDDAADLGSGAATDGWVLTADGAGGAAWEVASGGSSVTDYVRTRAGTTQDLFDMAETWNASGTTFTAIKMDVTDTASAADSLLMDLQVGGVSKFSVAKGAGAVFGANLIEQRNGTNAQTFNLYNTYTDASNYERGFMKWNSNVLEIGTEAAGTGSSRSVHLETGSGRYLRLSSGTTLDTNVPYIRFYANTTAKFVVQLDANKILANSDMQYAFTSGASAFTSAPDTGIARDSAGVVKVTNGSTGGGAMQLAEITAPTGTANAVRIYAEDDGAGKTRLMAIFGTGAAQQIAIEP
jgi:hypothetical protein